MRGVKSKIIRWVVSVFLLGIAGAHAQTGMIRWVMFDAPPLSYLHGEHVTGFFPEMTAAVCNEMHARCEFSVVPFSRAMKILDKGEADAVIGITHSRPHKELRFGKPVVKTAYGLFTLPGPKARSINRFIDLQGLKWTVGTQGPSDVYEDLKSLEQEVSDLSIKNYPTFMEAIFAVHNGEINAVYGSLDVIRGLEKIAHMPPLHDTGFHQPMAYYYAWNPKVMSPQLAAAFDVAYQKLLKNGKITAIAHPYQLTLVE